MWGRGGMPEAGWARLLGTCVMKVTQNLEITPKLIDFGSSVIQLSQITRAGVTVQHPLRPAGWALLLVAAGLMGRELFLLGGKLALPANGSVAVWAACGAAALGIFMVAYARRSLLIATSDGARLLLPAGDASFAAAFTGCVRDAIEAGPNALGKFQIDISARTIERLPLHDAALLGRAATAASTDDIAARRPSTLATAKPASALSGTATANGLTNGARAPLGAPLITRQSEPLPTHGATTNTVTSNSTAKPADLAARLATSAANLYPNIRGDGLRDLTALMTWVSRSDVQHKDALLDLLRVVEDHEKGGSVTREDAQAHWRSFADYVQQYLGSMQELPDLTRRAGRGLGLPERSARV